MKFNPLVAVIIVLSSVSACSDTNIIIPTSPSGNTVVTNPPNGPTPVPPVITSKIEFRVVGNASGAVVRHSDSLNGLTQVTTTLPYLVTWTTAQSSLFLNLEATPTSYNFAVTSPFMVVQIFINGVLFREASSNNFFLSTLSVSGTWRQ